jgi:hypothetical protein
MVFISSVSLCLCASERERERELLILLDMFGVVLYTLREYFSDDPNGRSYSRPPSPQRQEGIYASMRSF